MLGTIEFNLSSEFEDVYVSQDPMRGHRWLLTAILFKAVQDLHLSGKNIVYEHKNSAIRWFLHPHRKSKNCFSFAEVVEYLGLSSHVVTKLTIMAEKALHNTGS